MYSNASFREIRALHDDDFVRVYQAYSDAIADLVVEANSFEPARRAGIWSTTRMTWIKPSAVWMAYRCGWTTMKDDKQARVLALDLSRSKFEEMLLGARLAKESKRKNTTGGKPSVVVQWDPEREMCGTVEGNEVLTRSVSHVRSIQIGLRGHWVAMLLDPSFVIRISDVTQDFRQAAILLRANDKDAAAETLWRNGPERPMKIPEEIRVVLGMNAAV